MRGCRRTILFLYAALILLVLSVALIAISTISEKTEMDSIPSWLEGMLVLSTVGSKELIDLPSVAPDQYLCAFDFTDQTIQSMRVPTNARLVEYEKAPMIVYQDNALCGNGSYSWLYYESCIEDFSNPFQSSTDEYAHRFRINPLVLYGIRNEGDDFGTMFESRSFYYLCYGASEDCELEYRLVREDPLGNIIVYQHFPLNYDISQIHVSISPSGRIAWRELVKGSEVVFVSDGETTLQLMDDKLNTCDIYWLDDARLFYTADISERSDESWEFVPRIFVPRIWHVDTGEIEDLNESWARKDVVFPCALESIAVDATNRYLAGYISSNSEDGRVVSQIVLVSLTDGESYTFIPWNQQMDFESIHTYPYRAYGKDDSGSVFYDPGERFNAQLVWCDEASTQ